MATITPRVPAIDLAGGVDPRWYGNSAAHSQWLNTLSHLIPAGEIFFCDAVRRVAARLDLAADPDLDVAVRNFLVQESAHSAQHGKLNHALTERGYRNFVERAYAAMFRTTLRYLPPLANLAFVCAIEHYMTTFSRLAIERRVFDGVPADIALLWYWHACEEIEHKAVCFDLYRAAGGGWPLRAACFLVASFSFFVVMFATNYALLLRRDGCFAWRRLAAALRSPRTWPNIFGPVGLPLFSLLAYLGPAFHPDGVDDGPAVRACLARHADRLRVLAPRT